MGKALWVHWHVEDVGCTAEPPLWDLFKRTLARHNFLDNGTILCSIFYEK